MTIFFRKLGKMSQNLSSAAVVIGALRVKHHSKIDKTKVLETDVSLMQVKSIAECSKGSILQ